jgi:serine/threonine protein kinase
MREETSVTESALTNNYSLKCTDNKIDEASIKNYKLLKTIGEGLYSKVKLAASKSHSGRFYAIKIIKRHDVEKISLDVFKQLMLNEVTLLQRLNHPNIIRLVEYNCNGEIVVKNSGKTI